MKALFFLSALSCFVFSCATNEIHGFGSNPGNLRMYIHFPVQLVNSSDQVPVVMALHGCSQSVKVIEKQTGWTELADRYGFIVIYPEQKKVNNPMTCFRWYQYGDEEMEEVASIYEMLQFAKRNYNVDTSKVFIYGLSAGAVMTIHMLVHHPKEFAVGAALAGGPYNIGEEGEAGLMDLAFFDGKTPEEWKERLPKISSKDKFPRLILGHGNKDKLVNINSSFEIIDQFSTIYKTDVEKDSLILNFAGHES